MCAIKIGFARQMRANVRLTLAHNEDIHSQFRSADPPPPPATAAAADADAPVMRCSHIYAPVRDARRTHLFGRDWSSSRSWKTERYASIVAR